MENRDRLRVQKKKPIKRSSRRKVSLRKVLDYLKSDTFMYAPLLSPLPSSHAFNTFPSEVVELKKPVKERQWLGEYLISDVYMYAPLLHLPHSPQEPLRDCRMNRMDDSTRRLTMKVNQQTDHLGNANQSSESYLRQTGLSNLHTWRHPETLKHTVYQGIVTLNSQPRAHG
ncbi:uncharacterized protein LOC109811883 [Cajanus cajan]|uniref:uncharacterized protein LOC109811883 n=1 Tax=Cajanus cajan TaxID=3821 RepID=UPI00098DD160|nr:uncharacterized protein LOC109811883 [Cajanus cajan]